MGGLMEYLISLCSERAEGCTRVQGNGRRERKAGAGAWSQPGNTTSTRGCQMSALHGHCTVNCCSTKTWSATHLRTFTQISGGYSLTSLTFSFRKVVEEPLYCTWSKRKCAFGAPLEVLEAFSLVYLLYTALKKILKMHAISRSSSLLNVFSIFSNTEIISNKAKLRTWIDLKYRKRQRFGHL